MGIAEIRFPPGWGISKVLPASGGDVLDECPFAGSGALHHLLPLVAQVPRSPQVLRGRHTDTVPFDGGKYLVEIACSDSEEHVPDQALINRHTVQIVCFATEV
jgi:hypothetical protein